VPAGYFRNSKIRIQEIALRVKAYQFKEASDAIRQQFGEKQTATVSKQSFQNKSTG
jgi:DNA polymerase-3 subunit alpha